MKKRLSLGLLTIFSVLFLTGCGAQVGNYITPENASGFWEVFAVLPLTQFITFLYEFLGGSLGLAIIVATVLSRLVVMPLMLKSTNSMAKMQEIAPAQQKITEKYANKKDPESQMKMRQEIGALYKDNGVNPAAGCLPMLVQMPIMIAFFQAVSRHPLIAHTTDSSYFLGVNLGQVSGIPNYILGISVAVLMFYSQVRMQKRTQAKQPEAAVQSMKMMNYLFTGMMLLMVISAPVAMGIFFLVGQIMMTIQSFIMKKPAGPSL